jgi:hypothetical protein
MMNCNITTTTAAGSGVNTNTIVGIVYGTISISIMSIQLFFEYKKYRQLNRSGECPASLLRTTWIMLIVTARN